MNGVERSNDGVVLKTCPFCGGEAGFWESENATYPFQIICFSCFNGTDKCRTEDDAIRRWNTRKPLERVLKRLEDNSFWTEATFDEDGFCNDDSEKVIGLYVAIEIIEQELM